MVQTEVDYDLLEHLVGNTWLSGGSALTIAGVQAANGSWFVDDPNPKPLWSGVIMKSGTGCAIVEASGDFAISFRAITCDTGCYSFCEYY